ncbi:MAG TPA: DsbA family protein [Candidatus Limnocylindria bacterium]|jgi:predicted DsbA family dithiol-disulfide isomerase|nr:DsbA family protein [Candidatus Limnocylindria bacterium]
MSLKITYYLEVISSWCHWAEPAWAELKHRYDGRAEFVWKLSLMDASGLPTSRAQCEWFYRRSGPMVRSPYMLNAGWYEPELKEYLAPNLVAEAAKDFGVTDDRVRLAIAHAGLREGLKVGRWEIAAEVAAKSAGLVAAKLLAHARSPEVEARARATTAEFHALQVTQRPAFVIEDSIGDKAVFSGLASATPLAATIEAMLSDTAAYASHKAHFGGPPEA